MVALGNTRMQRHKFMLEELNLCMASHLITCGKLVELPTHLREMNDMAMWVEDAKM
jgi:hypothetical protein